MKALRAVGGLVVLSTLACGVAQDIKQEARDTYEQTFRTQFAKSCAQEVGAPEVCGCLADELVKRVPPKKLVELTLHPRDPELKRIVEETLKTCGREHLR